MGREAHCDVAWGDDTGTVKVLLDRDTLILRGAVARRIKLSEMRDIRVVGTGLRFVAGSDEVLLALPRQEATRWARAIAAPPPSLREKLGLDLGRLAILVGVPDDPALQVALRGCTTDQPDQASMVVARVHNDSEAMHGVRTHALLRPGRPIWVVHDKGRGAVYGEAAVRSAMRAAGFTDTKVAAVSDWLTATRYVMRQEGSAEDKR
jgi:hypothetical protein